MYTICLFLDEYAVKFMKCRAGEHYKLIYLLTCIAFLNRCKFSGVLKNYEYVANFNLIMNFFNWMFSMRSFFISFTKYSRKILVRFEVSYVA